MLAVTAPVFHRYVNVANNEADVVTDPELSPKHNTSVATIPELTGPLTDI